jgi:hypothetical protein
VVTDSTAVTTNSISADSNVTFTGTVLGAHNLTVNTSSGAGSATIIGTATLASLSTSGLTTLSGSVTTTGSQTYGGAVTLTGDLAATATATNSSVNVVGLVTGSSSLTIAAGSGIGSDTASSVNLTGGVTLSGAGSLLVTTGTITVGSALTAGSQTYDAQNVLNLTGTTYTSTGAGGNIDLNTDPALDAFHTLVNSDGSANPPANPNAPRPATILGTNPNLTVSASNGNVTTGDHEFFVATDSLAIAASGTVSLGEVIAGSILSVSAANLVLLDREYVAPTITINAGSITAPNPNNSATILVANSTGSPVYLGAGGPPPNVQTPSQIDGNQVPLGSFIPSLLDSFTHGLSRPQISATTVQLFINPPAETGLTVAPEADISTELTTALLNDLGIKAESTPPEQQRDRLISTSVVYFNTNWLTPPPLVSDARLSNAAIQAVLDAYLAAYANDAAIQDMVRLLDAVFTQFTAAGGKPDDAAGFRAYLESSTAPNAKEALADIVRFAKLFHQLEQLGLTGKDLDYAKNFVLYPMGSLVQLTPQMLRRTIEQPLPAVKTAANPAPTIPPATPQS